MRLVVEALESTHPNLFLSIPLDQNLTHNGLSIYKGHVDSDSVAVKVMRIFGNPANPSRLNQVHYCVCILYRSRLNKPISVLYRKRSFGVRFPIQTFFLFWASMFWRLTFLEFVLFHPGWKMGMWLIFLRWSLMQTG